MSNFYKVPNEDTWINLNQVKCIKQFGGASLAKTVIILCCNDSSNGNNVNITIKKPINEVIQLLKDSSLGISFSE